MPRTQHWYAKPLNMRDMPDPKMKPDQIVLVNLSGRGDKDVAQAAEFLLKGNTVIKPDPMGALNFAKEHGLPQRRSDEVLRELREGEEE